MKKKLEADVSDWRLLLNMPMLPTLKHKKPSKNTMAPSGMPKLSLRVNRGQRKLPEMDFWLLNARRTPPRMLLKRLALSLNNLTVHVVSLNKNFQTPMNNFLNSLA